MIVLGIYVAFWNLKCADGELFYHLTGMLSTFSASVRVGLCQRSGEYSLDVNRGSRIVRHHRRFVNSDTAA